MNSDDAARRHSRVHAIRPFPLYSYCPWSLADLSLELEASVSRPSVLRVSLSFESRINARSVRIENRTERRRSGIKDNMTVRICIPPSFSALLSLSRFLSLFLSLSLSLSLYARSLSFLIKIHFVAPALRAKGKKYVAIVQLPSCNNCGNGIRDTRSLALLYELETRNDAIEERERIA